MLKRNSFVMRSISILFAMVMLVAMLCGCSLSSGDLSGNSINSSTSGSDKEQDKTDKEENITLTYFTKWKGSAGLEPQQTPFFKELQEKTGIKVDIISATGGNEQLNLLIAADDLPDIVEHDWINHYAGGPTAALKNNVIISLNDFMPEFAPNLSSYLESDSEIDKLIKTDDGQYYAFPFIREAGSYLSFNGIAIRQDWLDELNLPMPTTIDDWYITLTAFKEKKNATAALSWNTWFMGQFMLLAHDTLMNNNEMFYDDNGTVKFTPFEPGYKKWLETMHKWYSEGLIDPDVFSQKDDAVWAKVGSDQTGAIMISCGSGFSKFETLKTANPNLNMVPAPIPVLKEGDTLNASLATSRYTSQDNAAISAKCKEPEAAIRFMDYRYSEEGIMLCNYGVENESYTMVDGVPELTEQITNNPDGYSTDQAVNIYRGSANQSMVYLKAKMEQSYGLQVQKDAIKLWDIKDCTINKLPPLTFKPEETESVANAMNEIQTYVNEMRIKYIIGSENLDTYDQFLEQLEKMNVEAVRETYQAAFDRFKQR